MPVTIRRFIRPLPARKSIRLNTRLPKNKAKEILVTMMQA